MQIEEAEMIVDVRDLNGNGLYERVRNILWSTSANAKRIYIYINAGENARKMKAFMEMSGFSARICNRKDGCLVKAI